MLPVRSLRVMLIAVVAGYCFRYVSMLITKGPTADAILGVSAAFAACWMCVCILKLLKCPACAAGGKA